ncbi:hypothetical protein [Metamycoplasma alkalescens]|uniref:hypothetical protein n=1 Tax=Metamycoplasma alkalescens TaxID=45363 RepID=UPI003D014AAA
MKSKNSKLRKGLLITTWVAIPTLIAAAIAGAIYYVVKNTRSIEKEFWSVEKFNEEVGKIKIKDMIVGSLEANKLYDDFNNEKIKIQKQREEYFNKHPQLFSDILLNENATPLLGLSISDQQKILKNAPPAFDPDAFLKPKINSLLNFEQTKYLDFKFTDLEKIQNDNSKLKIHFEVFLNYEYARGVFETNKIKSTPNSKYYFKSSQDVEFFSNDLKIYPGSSFYNNWATNKKDAEKIIGEINEKNKEHDKEIQELEEKKLQLKDNEEEVAKLDKQIEDLKKKKEELFKAPSFQESIFKWFKEIFEKTNAFSDIYPSEKNFKIEPLEKENQSQYVLWNPKKGLNELTIKFKFVSTNEQKRIESYPKIIIFTLDDI